MKGISKEDMNRYLEMGATVVGVNEKAITAEVYVSGDGDVISVDPPKKKNKYGAIKTVVDGHVFASKKESKRYSELKVLQVAGVISDLELQPKYELVVNGQLICRYVPDFRYVMEDEVIVEDVKGGRATKTRDYRIRKKLMRAIHGIEILET